MFTFALAMNSSLKMISVCFFSLTLLLGSGCEKPQQSTADATSQQAVEEAPSPGTTFGGPEIEVIEPMFPLLEEEPEAQEKNTTDADTPQDSEPQQNSQPEPESNPEAKTRTNRANFVLVSHTTAVPKQKYAADANSDFTVKLPPASDLASQIPVYIERLEKTVDDLDGSPRFVDDADVLFRDANTLAMIALALGLSEENNQYKKSAPAIVQAALQLEKVKNVDQANEAVAALKKTLTPEGAAGMKTTPLRWDAKIGSLGPMMKAVPNINTLVKRNLRTEPMLKRGVKRVSSGAAVLAVIGQGSLPIAAETIKPTAVRQWKEQCEIFRDASLGLNKAARDYEAGKATFADVQNAYETLSDTCDMCHKIFYPSGVGSE